MIQQEQGGANSLGIPKSLGKAVFILEEMKAFIE